MIEREDAVRSLWLVAKHPLEPAEPIRAMGKDDALGSSCTSAREEDDVRIGLDEARLEDWLARIGKGPRIESRNALLDRHGLAWIGNRREDSALRDIR